MEDKRILKTKRSFRQALIRMLDGMPFSKITVTDLCREASSARITFYTYYADKYALVDDMLEDYYQEAYEQYHVLERARNPEGDGIKGYEDLLECILVMYDHNRDFFRHVSPEAEPYLYASFYQKIAVSVQIYIERHIRGVVPKFPSDQTAALLCGGLWAVIHRCYADGMSTEDAHDSIREIYRIMLKSQLFLPTFPKA